MLKFLIASMLLLQPTYAGLPPTTTKGSADSAPVITFELDTPNMPITHTGTRASIGTVPVAGGGTGQTTLTNHGVLVGASTSALTQLAAAAAGTLLTGQGASADPSFSATPTLGIAGTTLGTLSLAGNTLGAFTQQPSASTTSYTVTWPNAQGAASTFLKNDGSGGLSWTTTATTAASVQKFVATGTQTGWLFNISTSSTVAVGDTYTNNGNTYTVQGALSAQSGSVLWMSGTGTTSGTTLTRASGSGTSSITFSTKIATATYTKPTSPAPLYIEVEMIGAGGGGCGSGTASCGAGNNGTDTYFGANVLQAGPGLGATQSSCVGTGGTGGALTVGGILVSTLQFIGASGSNRLTGATLGGITGGNGASSFFGGAGTGTNGAATGGTAQVNTGSGGGGGGCGSATNCAGAAGGGAGGYMKVMISASTTPALAATYPYIVGVKGTGGTAGTSGAAGGDGADGVISVKEYYQ
jgi:hypothetical protein